MRADGWALPDAAAATRAWRVSVLQPLEGPLTLELRAWQDQSSQAWTGEEWAGRVAAAKRAC